MFDLHPTLLNLTLAPHGTASTWWQGQFADTSLRFMSHPASRAR